MGFRVFFRPQFQDFQECVECNSLERPDCARNTTLNTSKVCNNYLGTCITGIDAHGATHRRCSNNYANETNEFPNDHFRVCISNNCNTDIFPTNRLHCYQCNGEPECDFINRDSTELSTNKLKPEACSTFSVLDQCFAYLSDSK